MSQGLQYQRTDKAIVDAFLDLVIEGSFEKLTVQNIIDRAMISKNTFYSHYRDKYDIAEQLFTQYKKSFNHFLRKNYGEKGKELAQKEQGPFSRDEINSLATKAYRDYLKDHGKILMALNKIQTDKVSMQNFIKELFKERYIHAPSNANRPMEELILEGEIYAGVFSAISQHLYPQHNPLEPPFLSSDIIDQAICNAFLYSMGIIEKKCNKEGYDSIMDLKEQARTYAENYQWNEE